MARTADLVDADIAVVTDPGKCDAVDVVDPGKRAVDIVDRKTVGRLGIANFRIVEQVECCLQV